MPAAKRAFWDIAMPPYQQNKYQQNKGNKNVKKVAKRDPLYIDGQCRGRCTSITKTSIF